MPTPQLSPRDKKGDNDKSQPVKKTSEPAKKKGGGFFPGGGYLVGANKYDVEGEKKNEGGNYQNWNVKGQGFGNRDGDVKNEKGEIENAEQGAPDVAEADLKGLDFNKKEHGGGVYTELGADAKGWDGKWTPTPESMTNEDLEKLGKGKYEHTFYKGKANAGARAKVGVAGEAEVEGKYGKGKASGDAYALAEAGADVNAKLSTQGAFAGANAHVKAGVGAEGDLDYTSPELKVNGVDDPLTAGVGVHGDVFAGAKAGTGVKIGAGPKFTGAEFKAGAFAGAEANVDVHGHVGPVKGKLGVAGLAGAGAGIEGSIVYKDGKIRIGGKMYAALGLGAEVSGEVEIDLKQAVQLGIVTAQEAYKLADGDKDGKLTLNDPATRVAQGLDGGAKAIDKGVDKTIQILDRNHDGKFTADDFKVGAD